jgi:dimethylamine corrinoid protein
MGGCVRADGLLSTAELVSAIMEGDASLASQHALTLLASGGHAPQTEQQLVAAVEDAMRRLDAKCTAEEFNLLEIMLSGRAATEVMKILYPEGRRAGSGKGTVVIATMEGDIHDLGKGILKMILTGNGYRVVDCGVDCSPDRLVEVVAAERPLAVGVSGLLTTVMPQVRAVRPALEAGGSSAVRILAGGAALKQSTAEALNVDYLAESAFDGVHYLDEIRVSG